MKLNLSDKKRLPYATIVVAAVNILVFFRMLLTGALDTSAGMLDHGALFMLNGTYMGGFHQLFTAMFLHFDIYHLGSNLLIMVILGDMLEKRLGSVRFLVSYLMSGLAGNIATVFFYGILGKTAISAGASGAVFGLVGLLCCLVFRNRGAVPGFSRNRMVLMLFLLFYNGFRNAQINTVAHAAGLLAGILFGFLFNNVWKTRQKDCENGTFPGN